MFLNLYFQPRESLYQRAREPLMKAQEGKRTDGKNHNRQFFTSPEHQAGDAKTTQACQKKKKSHHPAVGVSTILR